MGSGDDTPDQAGRHDTLGDGVVASEHEQARRHHHRGSPQAHTGGAGGSHAQAPPVGAQQSNHKVGHRPRFRRGRGAAARGPSGPRRGRAGSVGGGSGRAAEGMNISWHPAALRELRSARAWYRAKDHAVERRFTDEIVAAVLRVRARPKGRPEFEPGLRRCLVRRFPYSLVYRLSDEGIEVLVLTHHRRKTRYWGRRVN